MQVAFGWVSHSFLHVWRETPISYFTWPRGPVILQFFALRVLVACNNTPACPFSSIRIQRVYVARKNLDTHYG